MRRYVVPVVVLFTVLVIPSAASAALGPSAIERQLGSGVEAARSNETGLIRFIGTEPGISIAIPAAPPKQAALSFIDSFAAEFGLRDASSELDVTEVNSLDDGRTSVRLQQVHQGVPVIGGQLIVNLDDAGDVLSLSGETEPSPKLSTDPETSAAEADDVALASVSKNYGVSSADLAASEPVLSIYDSRLLGGPGLEIPRLVWQTEVTKAEGVTDLREFVLVDAASGSVALSFSQIADAKARAVCDANNTDSDLPCVPANFDRNEGGPPSVVDPDVNLAYDFAGGVYDLYFNNFGRDSLNGAGLKLLSTTRYCELPDSPECPYNNAFWNGEQMAYGQDLVTDDIVAHELTHGVTGFTSGLFYYYQSGAINESISDVFGELFDLQTPPDLAADRWLVGEDAPAAVPFRDMEDPPAFGDPDRMLSPNYTADLTEVDAGGVHQNSGVNNKAAFLLTDGGTFNGRTVTGLGIPKVLQLYYEVNSNLLVSGSDYQDLATALRQACTNLTGLHAITAANCIEVNDAVLATEMDQNPTAAPTTSAASCTTAGDVPSFVFNDDFENTASGNWAHSAVSGAVDQWYYPPSAGFTYATSGKQNLFGYNTNAVGDYAIAMTANVTIPPGGQVRFAHAFGFDDNPDGAYDGGVVEYSTDSGATWTDAGSLITAGGYSAESISAEFENPLAGRAAFVRESNGYGASRINLASLAGQPVRLRFRIGTDNSLDDSGWFIDDFQIYNCPPETTIDSGPADGSKIQVREATFGISATDPAATLECSVNGATFAACASPLTLTGLADGVYSVAVRGRDAEGAIDPSPAVRIFSVDTRCPKARKKLRKAKRRLRGVKKKLHNRADRGPEAETAERKADRGPEDEKAEQRVRRAKKKVKKARRKVKRVCVAIFA